MPPFFEALHLLSQPFCIYFQPERPGIANAPPPLPAGAPAPRRLPEKTLPQVRHALLLPHLRPDAVKGSPNGAAALAPSCPALLGSQGRADTTNLLRALD